MIAAVQGENGEYSRWQYDLYGRMKRSEPANAEPTTFTYVPYPATGVDPTKPSLELDEYGDAGDEHVTQFDLLGQPLFQKRYERDDGLGIATSFKYDESRRLTARSRPYFEISGVSTNDTFAYDAAGRLVQRSGADGSIDQYAYTSDGTNGLLVEHWDAAQTDPLAVHSTSIYDSGGRLTSEIQEAAAKDDRPAREVYVDYSYTAFDLVQQIESLSQLDTNISYDRRGRVIGLSDPSRGTRSFGYDAFGEQVTETVGAEVRSSNFDTIGRITTLQTHDGTTTWNWDIAANGLGKLGSATSPSGVTTTYQYDSQSQLTDVTQTIGNNSFDITVQPDAFGRIGRILYPTVNGSRFAVRYQYGPRGALDTILNDATNQPFWTLLEKDVLSAPTNPSGQFPQYRLGQNIVVHHTENPMRPGLLRNIQASTTTTVQSLTYDFDSKARVTVRNDNLRGLGETFDYDELNRLEHWSVFPEAGGQSRVRFDYDDFGNLTGRTYEAGAGTNLTFGIDGERGGGPYAVTSANRLLYGYDGEGNQSQAGARHTTFSTFGLPLNTDIGSSSYQLRYSANGERAEKQGTNAGGVVDDTIYVGGGLYRVHSANGVVENGYTVLGPIGPIAYLTAGADGKTTSTSYVLPDYLGSADTILDGATSAVVESRKFDPFGNRFDPGNPLGAVPAWTSHVPFGFTGHEHDLDLGLVNMKGRIFDPKTARFLTPDLFGIEPSTSQGLNSYAYVQNNPATLNDPTGFDERNPTGAGGSDPLPPITGGGPTTNTGWAPGLFGPAPSASNTKQYVSVDSSKRTVTPHLHPERWNTSIEPNSDSTRVVGPEEPWETQWECNNAGTVICSSTGTHTWVGSPRNGSAQGEDSFIDYLIPGKGVVAGRLLKGALGTKLAAIIGPTVARLGRALGKSEASPLGIRITQEGLDIARSHLAQFGEYAPNQAMLQRLQSAVGTRVTGADANFYLHEISESTMMGRGMSYEAAHAAALGKYGASPFSVYHPDVIRAFPEYFNSAWRAFWGLQ